MERAFRITRRIDRSEQPWMDDDDVIEKGEVVYSYGGMTYGCIGKGNAVTRTRGQTPFFEVPRDALEPISEFAAS